MVSITCPRCRAASRHPQDIKEGYCGRCHWYTGHPLLGSKAVIDAMEKAGFFDQEER